MRRHPADSHTLNIASATLPSHPRPADAAKGSDGYRRFREICADLCDSDVRSSNRALPPRFGKEKKRPHHRTTVADEKGKMLIVDDHALYLTTLFGFLNGRSRFILCKETYLDPQ